ncbi:MAG: hypothetical protein PW788_13115 [Micavibrio sp.]|nr:hypothetical protein [Micavibrio sp.]
MKKRFTRMAQKPAAEFEFFLDMDGVLSDFDAHAKAEGKYTADGKTLFDALDLKWWSSMPVCNGARAFFDGLAKIGPVRQLTAPILNSDCFRGKAEWTVNFRPEQGRFALLDLIICRADDKNLLARPNHILVDDRKKNVDAWVAAGGIGILHEGDFSETQKRVDAAMAEYRARPKTAPAPVVATSGKPEIFIGPNGVLADFQGHAQAHGKFTDDGKTKWAELDTKWWETIPAYKGARAFFDSVRQLGQTRFLTGPVPLIDSFEGDAKWSMAFRPESGKYALLDLIVCRSSDKNLLARPNHILIDDRQKNIDEWMKAGGIGILHKGDFAETLQALKDAIAALPAAPVPAKPQKPQP